MSQMRDNVTPQSVQSSGGPQWDPSGNFRGSCYSLRSVTRNIAAGRLWCCNMFLRHLTRFRSFSRRHGRISMGALEGTSDTNLREMRVSTSLPSNFHASSIPFRNSTWGPVEMPCSSSLLIPINLLRRVKNLFPLVIFDPLPLMSRYANNRFLSISRIRTSSMTRLAHEQTRLAHEQEFARPSHQTRKPFYITSRRQINPVLRENYASES